MIHLSEATFQLGNVNILNGISLKTLNNYELHSNFLLFGLSKNLFGIIVSPQILVGGENNYLSISLFNHF